MHSPPKIQNLRFTALTSQNKVLLRTFRWTTHGLIHRHAQNWTSFSPSPRKNKHLNQQPNKQNPTKRLSPKGHIRRHPRVSRGIQRNQIYRSRGAWTRNSSPRWWDHWRNHTTTTTTKIEKRRSPKKKQKQKKQWHSLNPSPWDSEDRRRRHNASKQASRDKNHTKNKITKKTGPGSSGITSPFENGCGALPSLPGPTTGSDGARHPPPHPRGPGAPCSYRGQLPRHDRARPLRRTRWFLLGTSFERLGN